MTDLTDRIICWLTLLALCVAIPASATAGDDKPAAAAAVGEIKWYRTGGPIGSEARQHGDGPR